MTASNSRSPSAGGTGAPNGQLGQATSATVTAKAHKSPIPRPGENVDPKPLAADQAELLAEYLDYIEDGKAHDQSLDSVSMQKAAALEALYTDQVWADEWEQVKPPKPNATGRTPEPNSRNRFNEWLAWRATKAGRTPPKAAHTYRLLNARTVQHHLSSWRNGGLTESAIRPLAWMLTRHYEARIPEVEQIAIELADGGPITDAVTRKAMSEWKRIHLGSQGVSKANSQLKARNFRPKAARAFDQLMLDDVTQAEAFLDECLDKLERAKGIA